MSGASSPRVAAGYPPSADDVARHPRGDRSFVAESWRRSRAAGVDPAGQAPESSSGDSPRDVLELALPVIERLLLDAAREAETVVAVFATDGTLVGVDGDVGTRRRAESMNFVPGADWSERAVGTSAPGTALVLDREVQISGTEHYVDAAKVWSCSAVPLHDARTGDLLGALDVTGDAAAVSPLMLALLRATAAAVEGHIALHAGQVTTPFTPRVELLRDDGPRWVSRDGRGHSRIVDLTQRHAEILLALGRHDGGLSAEQLAVLLDERDLDPVTIRAEMSRLRRIVGADVVQSRPYRLRSPIQTDVGTVLETLAHGDVANALARYSGPLLPRSLAPVVAELRSELSTTIRDAVLTSGDADLMRRWLQLPDARDDDDAWQLMRRHARPHWARATKGD